MTLYRSIILAAATTAFVGAVAAGAQAAPFFAALGDLPGGAFNSQAVLFDNVVSNDGSTVVGRGSVNGGITEAFRWTQAGGMQGLGDLPGGTVDSQSNSTSSDGSVVVGQSRSGSGLEAFRWTQSGGMLGLGTLAGGNFSLANSTSADGSVAVGLSGSASGSQAFRWTQAGGMVGLGDLAGGSFNSQATSTSADGSVVVGWSSSASGLEGFRWTQAGGMQGLGLLAGGGPFSFAYSTNADGSVVVGQARASDGNRASIWDAANGLRVLQDVLVADFGFDLTGWRLLDARGVSDDGLVIAGSAINPDGLNEAWVVNLRQDVVAELPEPAPFVFFGLGLAILGFSRRKRRA